MKLCFGLIVALFYGDLAFAWETDQYTLPAQPIAETGEEISDFIYLHLLTSTKLAKRHRVLYSQTVKHLTIELQKKKKMRAKRHTISHADLALEISQLHHRLQYYQQHPADYYQTQLGMVSIVQQNIGRAVAKAEHRDAIWGNVTKLTPYKTGKKAQLQTVFFPDRFDSIYTFAGFHRFLHASYFIFSSTIKLYGIELGMDKLGHLFNEGFQYYLLYQQVKNNAESETLALKEAIQFGVDAENSYFGRWVSGVYSNADLASNYAGLHFYINLFSPLTINGVTYPAILLADESGDYQINPMPQNSPRNLLKRFISDHMNEALNPSSLEYLQYIVVKEAVLSRCSLWQKKYPEASLLKHKIANLMRWNGEDYGFEAEHTISIYERCFDSSG